MAADGTTYLHDSCATNKVGDSVTRGDFYLPSTRYCGSKRRLSDWLQSKFRRYRFNTALDAFGGTATVSILMLQMEKKVSFHDAFRFNEISARALIGGAGTSMSRDGFIRTIKSIKPFDGFISQEFKGIYYLDQENMWLDGLLRKVQELAKKDADVILYCAFQACLQKRPYNMFHRANLNLRVAKNISRSFGNLKTWERSFEELMLRAFNELCAVRVSIGRAATIIAPQPLMSLPVGYDFVYLDPPYLREKGSETYLSRYHFLEGMARYSDWHALINRESKLKSIASPYLPEEWERPEDFLSGMDALTLKHKKSIVALSYMTGGVPEVSELKKIFVGRFAKVRVYKKPFSYALSSREVDEVLIIGEPG